MGTGASENIAISVSTSAELSPLKATEAELTTLGKSATAAATGTNALTVSAAQMKDALAKTGGDLNAAAKLLGTQKTATEQVTVATTALATTTVKTAAVQSTALVTTAKAVDVQSTAIAKIPTGVRTATNAIGMLSQAAVVGTGSIGSMVSAVGALSTGLGTLATSAKAVAAATWLTLLIQAGVLAYGVIHGFKQQVKDLNNELGDLASERKGVIDVLGGDDLGQKIEQINHAAEKQILQAKEISFLYKGQREEIIAGINTNRQKSIELANTQFRNEVAARAKERQDRIAAGALDLQLAQDRAVRTKTEFELSLEQIDVEQRQHDTEIRNSFIRRSASGAIIDLTAQEIEQVNTLLEQNFALTRTKKDQLGQEIALARQQASAAQLQGSDKLTDRFQGRLQEIELERQAQIRATGDVVTANKNAEQQKRALSRETLAATADALKSIEEITANSDNTRTKAANNFAKNFRAVIIGAKAAEAAVDSLKAFASVPAHLAVGDFAGAGLAALAGTQLAAAAAIGFSEAGGGGRAGGGGGGGSSPGSSSSTFAPRGDALGGNVVVNLYTTDPYGGENIRKVSWLLQRGDITKRPIYVPATADLRMGAQN